MIREITIRKNGKSIPYTDWLSNEIKKLRIRRACASTDKELRAVSKDIEALKINHAIMTSNNPAHAAAQLKGFRV